MLTLTIGNSYSQITGLSASQEKQIRSELSYTIGGSAAFFSGFGNRRKSLIDKKGFFPTGLIHRLPTWTMKIVDNRKFPKLEIKPVHIEAYSWQKKALQAVLINTRGGIVAPTGSGKSRVMVMICMALNLKTLIIVPSLEIKKQLQNDFKNFPNVIVENIDSSRLAKLTDFDILILDEVHGSAAKTYQRHNKTSWKNISRRYFFSATYFRNDPEENLLFEAIAGQPIYTLTYAKAVKNKNIVPIETYYLDIPKQEVKGYGYQAVYKEAVVNNVERNIRTAHVLHQLSEARLSTLCLVKEVAHGRILANLTGLPFICGEDEASRDYIRQFKNGEIIAVIATTAMMGEGIDTKPCEYVIIAGGGKAKSAFMQQVGRCVRNYSGKESGKVILIRDTSHKYLIKHYNAQKKILFEEYACIPTKLEL